MLFDAISELELFINVFVTVYILAILLYILASWVRLPYSLSSVRRFLSDVCDPYLRMWRRILPFSAGPLDFTPMVSIFALIIASQIVDRILDAVN